MKKMAGILVVTAWVACAGSFSAQIDTRKLVDLTYPFDERTIYWPTNKAFQWEKTDWGMTAGGYWYASANFAASEHGGTHIDAPIHFGKGQHAVDEIPIQRLVGPAVVVDVTPGVARDRDYRLTVEDLKAWEARHGRIPDGAIVLMYSGWGRHWPDRGKYLGSETPGDPKTLHFPGFSKDAAEFLVKERKIDGVGIDTPSIDHGPSTNFIAHQVLNGANLYALENVANLDKLPPKGATLIALPIKIKGGTGGPVRIIAILP
jgi:kynurenine formamidase